VIEPSVFQSMVNIIRYAKIHLVFLTQGVRLLPANIREACSVIIAKRMNDLSEVNPLSQMMMLNTKEQQEFIINMEIADGIFINKEVAAIPVHILIPLFPETQLTDNEIEVLQDYYKNTILKNVRKRDTSHNIEQDKEELSYEETLLLNDLKKFAFDFQSERSLRLNMPERYINENLESLAEKGYLQKHDKINLGKGQGQFQLYVFTQKAVSGYGKQEIKGKGSIEHSFWQYRCAKYFLNIKYNVEIEHFLSNETNESIDVIAFNNEERIAIEIELNDTPHIINNITKCVRAGFNKTIVAVYGSQLMKRIQSMILSNIELEQYLRESRIEIKMLNEFLQ